ncbi:MAG TPA: 23S rRNA (adenine(2503)-C(2))-methyltransferase RlmN [Candidatus Kapabacteria bacterium]|nr:23S rRNA (adenine(2503)-C(2))-methyltransferase RlmN [Candidatus Kapabacteria bacterium]
MNCKQNIKNFSKNQIEDYFISIYEKKYRVEQLENAIYNQRISDFSQISNFPKILREKIQNNFDLDSLKLVEKKECIVDNEDETTKYLFELTDGQKIESVLIPSENRNTICVSTQVGCPVACKFCASGKIDFMRNLDVAEIIDQFLMTERISDKDISNIVFMGMGEPLLNFQNVLKAINIFLNKINISRTKITLSTVGLVPEIKKLADENIRIKLAISLHATNDFKREKIIPIAKKYNINDLIGAVEYYYNSISVPVTYEYILFEGFNDTSEDIKRLAKITKTVNSKVNLIPFNDISFIQSKGSDFVLKAASPEKILDFAEKLRKLNVIVNIRNSAGANIFAACGQLARVYNTDYK